MLHEVEQKFVEILLRGELRRGAVAVRLTEHVAHVRARPCGVLLLRNALR